MKIEMLKGAANPKPNDLMILTIAEISKIRSENAKLRDIAKRAIEAIPFTEGYGEFSYAAAVLRAELEQIEEEAK